MQIVKSIAVIGLGYVGLPIALLASKKGFDVIGIDSNDKKINNLLNGKSYINDVDDEDIKNTKTKFTTDISRIKNTDAIIICVPTPVDSNKIPDLTPVKGAVSAIAPHIKKGSIVILESTVNPGVCDDTITPLLQKKSNKIVGKDIYLAHCPERINPGDPKWNVSNINRVVGANSEAELAIAVDLYKRLIDAEIKPMKTIKEAEAVKIVENSFRDINIAFVNELAMSFHKLGINLENVIDGASTKPFAFMPHRPGCGVGGHCIPVDPYYLIEYAHGYGFDHKFLTLARDINESMPQFTVSLLTESLNEIDLSLKGTRVALLGLSYKANVGDGRESPAQIIKDLLIQAETDLVIYDPYFTEQSTVNSIQDALSGAVAVVIATAHDEFKNINIDELKSTYNIKAIVDGRNLFKNQKDQIIKKGIKYSGIGI